MDGVEVGVGAVVAASVEVEGLAASAAAVLVAAGPVVVGSMARTK